jgi:hypothetical protein
MNALSLLSKLHRRRGLQRFPCSLNTHQAILSYSNIYRRSIHSEPENKKNLGSESKEVKKVNAQSKNLASKTLSTLKVGWDTTLNVIRNPKQTWKAIKEEALHYWLGTKLLWSEIKLTTSILRRVLGGHLMSRRERIQLIRTTNDLFRLVPFAVFVIVPFMEFLLPFALKIFPNMLPSTFQVSSMLMNC